MPNGKTAIAGRQLVRICNRLRILVESCESSLRREALQDQARMPPAPIGGVDIVSVGVDRKRFHSFVQQDGLMIPCVLHHDLQKEKSFKTSGISAFMASASFSA